MKKNLDQLSTEELGSLFPIIITDHNPEWKQIFHDEKDRIITSIGNDKIICIEHIGSTTIPHMKAKPTIDILIEIKKQVKPEGLIKAFQKLDYHYIHRPENPPPHMMFTKGYTIHGFVGQAFHLHIRYKGDWEEIRFRDYLITHPHVAKAYEELKVRLAHTFKHNREAYTEGKTAFITSINTLAKKDDSL